MLAASYIIDSVRRSLGLEKARLLCRITSGLLGRTSLLVSVHRIQEQCRAYNWSHKQSKSERTSLTLEGCDGSLYTYSRAAILEWCDSKMAGQNDPDSGRIPKWRDKAIMIHEGLFKRVGQTIWLLIEEEPEGGGVTDVTYSKRYALFWSVSAAHYNCRERVTHR